MRYAVPSDARVLAEITCAAFGEFPDFDVTLEQSRSNWHRTLTAEGAGDPRPHHTRVREEPGGTLVGVAMGGPAEPGLGHPAEIYNLAVRRDRLRRGHADALLRAVATDLHSDGHASLVVKVLTVNTRARDFYTALGGLHIAEARDGQSLYCWPDITLLAAPSPRTGRHG
ncbi:hypothetical protein GCM10027589_17900 [Actinocorallia lasiicapitis]